VDHRVPTDMDYDTVRDVDFVIGQKDGVDTLGPLGMMQALVRGTIAADYDTDGKLVCFKQWAPGEPGKNYIPAYPPEHLKKGDPDA
jgi:hypothetical protein